VSTRPHSEWLRRERRRVDAREQLRTAHERFTEFGMEAFPERARVELQATGEQEIAAQLFISPSTVDYHLRKAFHKLGLRSRHQLKEHTL
jgi:DNA-binding NarL/FixJ family response regulator